MKIALWQTVPHHDPQNALGSIAAIAKTAAAIDVQALIVPELMLGGYNIGRAQMEILAGQASDLKARLQQIARENHLAIICGLALPASPSPFPASPSPFNGVITIDSNGDELARYHKTHLFGDVDKSQFTAGSKLPEVFLLNGWRVGLAICYDIEFPEIARHLALNGAEIVLVPTANMTPFDTVPTRLIPARAEENAVYLAYANYVGSEGSFTYGGLSCICGPDGNDLARASTDSTELIVANLDRNALESCRARQTHLSDRRADLYGSIR